MIDCHLYHQPGRLIVHLVNLTNSATWRAPVHELISVGPFKVAIKLPADVPGKGPRLLVAEKAIISSVKDGWISFEVNSILDHEVVVIG